VSDITSAARAAVQILEAAEAAGLPLPAAVTSSRWVEVRLQFSSLVDLEAWSTYLDSPISNEPGVDEPAVIHRVQGDMFEQRVDAFTVTYDAAEVPPDRPVVLNPEAIGDPDQTPVVQLPPAMVAHFERTRCVDCQQINHTHAADCPKAVAK